MAALNQQVRKSAQIDLAIYLYDHCFFVRGFDASGLLCCVAIIRKQSFNIKQVQYRLQCGANLKQALFLVMQKCELKYLPEAMAIFLDGFSSDCLLEPVVMDEVESDDDPTAVMVVPEDVKKLHAQHKENKRCKDARMLRQ